MIQTERLYLRPINTTDADRLFAYRSDARVNRYQGWIPKTLPEVYDFIRNRISPHINIPETWHQLAVVKKENNELIGDIGIHFFGAENLQVEIGCTLDQRYHKKGYASESLRALISYIFTDLQKRRIIASIDPRNHASITLFERLGFRKEAHFRESLLINGEWVDDLIYALLKKDWSAMPDRFPVDT